MIEVSEELKKAINNANPMFARFTISFVNGTNKTFEKDDILMDSDGFKIEQSCSGTSSLDLGAVSAAMLTIKLINYDGYLNDYDFADATIYDAMVGVTVNDSLEETIVKGTFYVDEQDFNGGVVTLKCYDAMAKLDEAYTGITSGNALEIVTGIANKYGIELNAAGFNNPSTQLTLGDDTSNYTDREVLRCVCEVTCNFAVIDRNGKLVIKWYGDENNYTVIDAKKFDNPSTDIVDAGNVENMQNIETLYSGTTFDAINNEGYLINNVMSTANVGIADVEITGIKISVTDNDETKEYTAGAEGYMLTIDANPFVNANNAQSIANSVWDVLKDTRFRTMTITTLANPTIEVGDHVVIEIGENIYETYLTNITFAVGQLTSITVGADSPRTKNAYSGATTATDRKITSIANNTASKTASQFAGLISQSLGMYEIREKKASGGEIIYLSAKPTLDDSIGSTVWRMDVNVFSVTTNYQGDNTEWVAGFDSSGNVVANVLDVVGINADWVNAGTIKGQYLDLSTVDAKLALKVGVNDNNQIVTMLNASADTINIKAGNGGINISGNKFTLNSTYTTISADGTITCKKLVATNGTFTGTISGSTISGGTIRGTTITGANGNFTQGFSVKTNITSTSYFNITGTQSGTSGTYVDVGIHDSALDTNVGNSYITMTTLGLMNIVSGYQIYLKSTELVQQLGTIVVQDLSGNNMISADLLSGTSSTIAVNVGLSCYKQGGLKGTYVYSSITTGLHYAMLCNHACYFNWTGSNINVYVDNVLVRTI